MDTHRAIQVGVIHELPLPELRVDLKAYHRQHLDRIRSILTFDRSH
jgi:hypothetical protein